MQIKRRKHPWSRSDDTRKALRRQPLLERLETRQLMASEWTNSCNAFDVTNDGTVTALDALLPINHLARREPGELPLTRPQGSPFLDSDGNGRLSALDALVVINQLGRSINNWSATFDISLENDSAGHGAFNDDGVTNDARIAVHASSPIGFQSIRAQLDGGEPFEVSHSCGSFVFDPQLASDGSDDGQHTVRITASNSFGAEDSVELPFVFDTRGPSVAAGIAPESDTGLPGDRATSERTIAIVGTSEPNQVVELPGLGRTTTADADGAFRFDGVDLNLNANAIEVLAVDDAGNTTNVTTSIVGTPCDFDDDHVVGLFREDALPSVGSPIPNPDLDSTALPLTSTIPGHVQYTSALLNQDFFTDIVTVSRATDEVIVYEGGVDGNLESELRYPSGGSEPTTVLVGDFVGDALPDIAVGHLDGTVGFLEGLGDNGFLPRPELNVTGLGTIVDLTTADFDNDGDRDLVVSGGDRVIRLANDNDPVPRSPLHNGDFDLGLRGWDQMILGESPAAVAGVIQTANRHAQLIENESFLVSLSQTITIPPNPQTISFDLLELSLGQTDGSIPDAFEVSLLDDANQSLVAAIDDDATSVFNANPGGIIEFGSNVSVNGTTVSLDISQAIPGTQATLFFDLVGSESNHNSVATIGNVQVTPQSSYQESFSELALPGFFSRTAGVGHCDANRDGLTDVVVENSSTGSSGTFTVLEGDGSGGFVAQSTSTSRASGESVDRSIQIAEVVSGSLDDVGQVDRYTFTAASGQTLFFDVQDFTGLQTWTLLDPVGTEIFREGLTDREGVQITLAGEYTLTVSAFLAGNGPYQFQIHDVPATTTEEIDVDSLIEGELTVPGQEQSFEFDIAAGESLFFDVASDRPDFEWSLVDPGDNAVFQELLVDQGPPGGRSIGNVHVERGRPGRCHRPI